jgi:hypothetical protein
MTTLKFNEIWHYLSSSRPRTFTVMTPWSVPSSDRPFIRRCLIFYDLRSTGFRVCGYETTSQSLDKLIYTSTRQPCHDLFAVLMESYTLGYTELDLGGMYAICQRRQLNFISALKVLIDCYHQRLGQIRQLQKIDPPHLPTFIADTQEELVRALSLEAEYSHLIQTYPISSDPTGRLLSIFLRGQALMAVIEKKFLHDQNRSWSPKILPGHCFDPQVPPGRVRHSSHRCDSSMTPVCRNRSLIRPSRPLGRS